MLAQYYLLTSCTDKHQNFIPEEMIRIVITIGVTFLLSCFSTHTHWNLFVLLWSIHVVVIETTSLVHTRTYICVQTINEQIYLLTTVLIRSWVFFSASQLRQASFVFAFHFTHIQLYVYTCMCEYFWLLFVTIYDTCVYVWLMYVYQCDIVLYVCTVRLCVCTWEGPPWPRCI